MQDYTALMDTSNNQKYPITYDAADVDALVEEFLDLWQENIRLCSKEGDLFSLTELFEKMEAQDKQSGIVRER